MFLISLLHLKYLRTLIMMMMSLLSGTMAVNSVKIRKYT